MFVVDGVIGVDDEGFGYVVDILVDGGVVIGIDVDGGIGVVEVVEEVVGVIWVVVLVDFDYVD